MCPYIKKEDRDKYKNVVLQIANLPEITTGGDMEYLIAILQKKFMSTRQQRYTDLHLCTYATIHAGDEFRRRYLDVRESNAKKTNGDIELPTIERLNET